MNLVYLARLRCVATYWSTWRDQVSSWNETRTSVALHRMNTVSCPLSALVAAVALLGASPGEVGAQSTNAPDQLGAMPYSNGVTFRVWAPNASAVGVKGQFNGWGTTPLVNEGASGYWSTDIDGAQPGQEYKYRINNSFDKRDPRARRVTQSNGNSIIYDPAAFDWGGTPIPEPWRNDLVLYQMHVGTFAGGNPPSTFDQAIERLDHVRDLGVSAIKLMPVNEFPGGRSWGYNPSSIFAVETDYGGPNALKRFVRAAHERGLAVFMDVVHNHYGPSDLGGGIWEFDGWDDGTGGIYFYNDDRAHTPWGSTRPHFGRSEVRGFIRDQIMMWVDEYRIGGFRWDSVYNIINTDLGFNDSGRSMLNDINTELANTYPQVVRGAEDNAFDGAMNFENQWHVAYFWELRAQLVPGSDSERNMFAVAGLLNGWPGHHRVVFSEAHDYIASNHDRTRIPTSIDGGDPESIWARKRSLLGAGIVMTTPGIPMIFQGQEMLETYAFSDDTALRWDRKTSQSRIVAAYTDLIHSRRNLRGGMQGLKGTGVDVHHIDNDDKVVAYIRWDQGGGTDDAVVVANFSSTQWTNDSYTVSFPSDGIWYSHFNSDSAEYGTDFDDIGPAQVTVSGGEAAVDMGMYSLQIFAKVPPAGTGQVSVDPPAPSGCVDVTILFDPADGPLQGATNVVIHLGRNDWLDTADWAMVDQGDGSWAHTATVAEGTAELNMAFHDGATGDTIWDTNEGRNWRVGISDCAGLPGLSTVTPAFPQGCVPVTIEYLPRDGTLASAENVFVHLGHNDWLNIQTLSMTTNASGDGWITSYAIPQDTWQLDFAFHDGEPDETRTWDNNDSENWQVIVVSCAPTDFTGVQIDHPASDVWVPYTQTTFDVTGEASRMQDPLYWENQQTGEAGTAVASTNWQVASLPLGLGANLFRVSGTNVTENPNAGAYDRATNAAYASGWSDGADGGSQWGGGWTLSAAAPGGHFLANHLDEGNLDSGTHAWGLWANNGGLSEAVRLFADVLHPGDVFSMRFENNQVAFDTGVVGIDLQNRLGQNLFELIFIGGATNYIVNDAVLERDTGVIWTDAGLDLTFELTSPTDYRFTINGTELIGTLATTSETLISQFRVFNASAGDGSVHNLYFDEIAVAGEPLDGVQHTSSRTINRRHGPHFQTLDAGSADTTRIRFPVTEIGFLYDVQSATNLVTGPWMPYGFNIQGSGPPITVDITNSADKLFFRTSVNPID